MRPNLRSLEIWLGWDRSKINLLNQDWDRKCSKKKYLIFAGIERRLKIICSRLLGSKLNARYARSKIEINTWWGKIENICTFSVVKMRKICSFHICVQKFSNYLKYLPEVGADSGFSFIMLGKCLVSLENFFKNYAPDRPRSLSDC